MKYKDIQNLSIDELEQKVAEAKRHLASLKFDHAVTPLANPMQIRTARREVAQLLTAITAKQNAAN